MTEGRHFNKVKALSSPDEVSCDERQHRGRDALRPFAREFRGCEGPRIEIRGAFERPCFARIAGRGSFGL